MAKKILLIEDEPDHVMIIKERLLPLGYEVIEAGNGQQGIDLAKTEKPDLIILDVLMPGIDGFAVCVRLKAEPLTKNIPILILTALGLNELADKCREAGADDFIRKPWEAKDLREKIAKLI